ncbi:hypothetical protein KSP39_PZI018249 [Platanthera zijinensis]|uniref:EF-hand domain-containing protein n=2 Tax=Platanthera zijinensis TaxID=2320716 RepID=A0AAP0B3T6_9ASPA
MTLRSSRILCSIGRSELRRRSGVSGGASGEGDPAPSGRGLASFAKVAAGIVAVGGSGLGLWFLPDSADASFSDSSQPRFNVFGDAVAAAKQPRFLFGDSFRRRVFFKYEKRMRLLSPPEKIYEYFASFRSPEGEMFMSPADLMRAVVPVFPPSESSIVREGFFRGERSPGVLHCAPSPLFLLFDTNNDGLISFPEYIFFVTLLSISESSFSAAFKMFDLDNSGEIEKEEFKKVMAFMRANNRQGASHRNGLRTVLKARDSVENAGVVEYFFGKDGNERLKHDKFVAFLRDLQEEILRLEFDHYDVKSEGKISATDFALSMVASANINHINKFLDRVDVLGNDPHLKDIRISFEEFKAFAVLRKYLHLLSFAIFSFGEANGFLAKEDFMRASSQVCGISLSHGAVDIIFHVFDSNNDGNLCSDEFLRAMHRREIDIRQPNSTDVFRHSFVL